MSVIDTLWFGTSVCKTPTARRASIRIVGAYIALESVQLSNWLFAEIQPCA
jgi:hypothetical protein